jgi:D-alanyl-D-alanine dipeptidase
MLGLALAACGQSEKGAPPAAGSAAGPAAPSPVRTDAAVAVPGGDAATAVPAGDATAAPASVDAAGGATAVIPAGAKQLITAVVDGWDTTRATLRRWRREDAGWEPDGEPWPGVVGKHGAAWGAGLHGAGAPEGRDGPVKREGDGKSPAGVFALRGSYGYADAPPAGTRLPYTALDERWKCIDDPASKHYDRILDRTTVEPDWNSAEVMRRTDELYSWVVDVAHNPAHAPGGGSCIFLHVWRSASSGTAGCTAMEQRKLAQLLATLDPSAVFVLLPRAEYDALAPAWALPAQGARGVRPTR